MWANVHIVCFVASYAVALGLELTRMLFRSGLRGALMLGFGGAGLLAHTIYLANRVASAPGEVAPLSTAYDWYLIAAWVLAATYLYLTLHHPRAAIGLFLLPLVLGLIAVAVLVASTTPFAQSRAAQYWGLWHGLFLLLGTVTVSVGFVAGLMYLVQAWRLKHKVAASRGLQLPSLEWLEKTNSRSITYSLPLLAVGVLSGWILNAVTHVRSAGGGDALPWTDPVIISSAVTLVWLAAAGAFNQWYRPARTGRKVAYLTIATFLFLLFTLAATLLVPSQHRPSVESPGAAEPSNSSVLSRMPGGPA